MSDPLRVGLGIVGLLSVGMAAAHAATIDSTTSGNWIGTYGADGYILNAYDGGGNGNYLGSATLGPDRASLPTYVSSYSYSATAQQYVWATGATGDNRDLQDPANPTGPRNAATTFNDGDFSVTINVSRAHDIQLEIYGLDWDNFNGRDMTVTVGGTVPAQTVEYNGANGYVNGEWGIFDVNAPAGPLTISIHQLASGASNSVISGIMFDTVPEPASLGLIGLGGAGLIIRHRRV